MGNINLDAVLETYGGKKNIANWDDFVKALATQGPAGKNVEISVKSGSIKWQLVDPGNTKEGEIITLSAFAGNVAKADGFAGDVATSLAGNAALQGSVVDTAAGKVLEDTTLPGKVADTAAGKVLEDTTLPGKVVTKVETSKTFADNVAGKLETSTTFPGNVAKSTGFAGNVAGEVAKTDGFAGNVAKSTGFAGNVADTLALNTTLQEALAKNQTLQTGVATLLASNTTLQEALAKNETLQQEVANALRVDSVYSTWCTITETKPSDNAIAKYREYVAKAAKNVATAEDSLYSTGNHKWKAASHDDVYINKQSICILNNAINAENAVANGLSVGIHGLSLVGSIYADAKQIIKKKAKVMKVALQSGVNENAALDTATHLMKIIT
jgi:hypothetical protein